jgi:hypothetical protein
MMAPAAAFQQCRVKNMAANQLRVISPDNTCLCGFSWLLHNRTSHAMAASSSGRHGMAGAVVEPGTEHYSDCFFEIANFGIAGVPHLKLKLPRRLGKYLVACLLAA